MLQRPLAGAMSRAQSQNMGFYAAQPALTQMAQEERLRQDQDGLVYSGANRKRNKLKEKALQSPMIGMQSALPGSSSPVQMGAQTLNSIFGQELK